MKIIKLFFVSFWLCSFHLNAAIYYVDFEGGSDTNTGLSEMTAWKHCPGDLLVSGNAANANLTAGDIVYFKCGVTYCGNINLSSKSSWNGNAIVEGTTASVAADGITVSLPSVSGVTTAHKIYLVGEGLFEIASVINNTVVLRNPTFHKPLTNVAYLVNFPITFTLKEDWGSGSVIFDGSKNNNKLPAINFSQRENITLDGVFNHGMEFTNYPLTAIYTMGHPVAHPDKQYGVYFRHLYVHHNGKANLATNSVFWAESRSLNDPPAKPWAVNCAIPTDYSVYYIVASPATGIWAGHENEVAMWHRGEWEFFKPTDGLYGKIKDTVTYVRYSTGTSSWEISTAPNVGGITDSQGGYDEPAIMARYLYCSLFEDVEVYHHGDFVWHPDGQDGHPLDGSDSGIILWDLNLVTVTHCKVHDVGTDGIVASAPKGLPSAKFYVQFSDLYNIDTPSIHADVIVWYYGDATIRYNTIHDNGESFDSLEGTFHIYGNVFARSLGQGLRMSNSNFSDYGEIHNNIFAYNQLTGLWIRTPGAWDIQNNIFYENSNQPEMIFDRINNNDVIKNNIFVRKKISPTDNIILWNGSYITLDQFKALNTGIDGKNGEGCLASTPSKSDWDYVALPLFVSDDINNSDFRAYDMNSPQVDKGASVGVSMDMLGISRPQGAAWDIGAYEVVSSGPSLQINSPNGSEVWHKGEQRTITWTANEITGNLIIELLQNDVLAGVIGSDIAASVGSFNWTVGKLADDTFVTGQNLKIRIRTVDGQTMAEMKIR